MPIPQTLLLTDPGMLGHLPGPSHPESPRRLEAILELLQRTALPGTAWKAARPASSAELRAAHTGAHLEALRQLDGKSAQLDPDTLVSPGSYQAALLAAGAAVVAVEEVWHRRAKNAFALVRPPGHHALPDLAMGFCLLNNAAVAANAACALGAKRVLVLDWDVHHGNGTQTAFYSRSDVLYLSCHQHPYYPGTGAPEEVGEGPGLGFNVNVALPGGQGDADYGAVFEEVFLPLGEAYRPDLIIVSAGFDPHREDPIGGMQVTERGFAAMAAATVRLAEKVASGRLVLLLEGGYHLGALARSALACVQVLTGAKETFPPGPGQEAAAAIVRARGAQVPHWPQRL